MTGWNDSENYFGMNTKTPIAPPVDIIALAWARYDEIAMRLDRLIVEELNARDAVAIAADAEKAAHADKEALMGECTCPDDDRTTCQKCVAWIRVIGWSKQR